ncbi:MAG: hypothetical protein SF029_08790 [bacterium]|nr:hypothetical protein [bacterium]
MNATPSDLLEVYLIALRDDSQVPPPPGLDPALAAFARKLVVEQKREPAEAAVRARVWQKTLANVSAVSSPAPRPVPVNAPAPHQGMTAVRPMPASKVRRNRSAGFAMAAVAAAVVVIAVGILTLSNRSTDGLIEEPIFGGPNRNADAGQSNASTQVAAIAATATARENEIRETLTAVSNQPQASPTSTPVPDTGLNSTVLPPTVVPPGEVLALSEEEAQPLVVGQKRTGEISAERPVALYHFVADQAGAVLFEIVPDGFEPMVGYASEPTLYVGIEPVGAVGYSVEMAQPGETFSPAPVLTAFPTTPTLVGSATVTATPLPVSSSAGQIATVTPVPRSDSGQWFNAPLTLTIYGHMNPNSVLPLLILAEQEDVYVFVRAFDDTSMGRFTIEPRYVMPLPVTYDDVLVGELTTETPYMVYTFEGNAGDVLSVEVEGFEGFNTNLQLGNRVETLRWFDDDSGPGVNPELYRVPLTLDDTYFLVLSATLPRTSGRFQMRLVQEE